MSTRYFALIAGLIYALVGVLGFFPGLKTMPAGAPDLAVSSGYGYLLGMFAVNVLHNIVHLALGLWGLASYGSFSAARSFARGLAIIYALFTIMGLIPGLDTTFGLVPLFGNDVWLHAVTAIIAAYFGWAGKDDTARTTTV